MSLSREYITLHCKGMVCLCYNSESKSRLVSVAFKQTETNAILRTQIVSEVNKIPKTYNLFGVLNADIYLVFERVVESINM